MSRKLILMICIVVVAVFAFGYLLIPSTTISLLGLNTDSTGLLITQFIGVLCIGYVVMLWKMRDADHQEQKPVLLGVAAAMGFAFIVSLYHQLGGSFGKLGWIGVGNFGIGFLLFAFIASRK